MRIYLSHGGGVNSWALYLYLIEQREVPGEDFEAVFVDHGTDWPETYEYMQMMIAKGYPVTVIKPNHRGFDNLYDCCMARKILPNRQRRWCTHEFKVVPLIDYYQTPSVELIGFDVNEKTRIGMHEKNGVTKDYPLLAAGIDRQGCIDLIKRHGLPVPPKSGCWICPFQKREQWIELKRRHPDLFCKAVQLENLCNERRVTAGKKPVYFRDMPLEMLVLPKDSHGRRATSDAVLFDPDFDRPPCRCGLW
jgi:3'-phosphoadenosine 5'-phosphosulfate sulfotransferase (PAPS reductase)/FAD synthetase